MAQSFNITAKLQLQAGNFQPVINNLQQQIQGFKVNLNAGVNPTSTRGFAALTANVQNLQQSLNQTQQMASNLNQALSRTGKGGGASGLNQFNKQLNSTQKAISSLQTTLQGAENDMYRFGQQAALSGRRYLAFSLGAVSFVKLAGAIRRATDEAFEFQHNMVRLSQLGAVSNREIAGIADTITKLSTSLGVSSKQLADVTIYLKGAGLTTNEVNSALQTLAKTSLAPTFKDIRSTTEGLLSLRSQFNLAGKDFDSVFGSINNVAREFAAESEDIIEAVRRSGAAFRAASGDLQPPIQSLHEFIALFTSVRSTTRESAETIATSFRTIFARLQSNEVVKNLKEMGINLQFTREEAEATGKSIEGQFIGGYKAIQRIGQALKNVPTTDPRFAAVIQQIGGVRQVSKVIPLIQQTATAQKAYAAAVAGTTSLTRDADKAQDALVVGLNKVHEEFAALVREITQSKAFANLVNMFTTGATAAIHLLKALTPLIPLLTSIAAIKIGMNFTNFTRGFVSQTLNPRQRFAAGGVVASRGASHSDSVHLMAPEKAFVIRAPIARKISRQAKKYLTSDDGSRGHRMVPVAVMPGEIIVPPEKARRYAGALHEINKGYSSGGFIPKTVRLGASLDTAPVARGHRQNPFAQFKRQRFAIGGPLPIDMESYSNRAFLNADRPRRHSIIKAKKLWYARHRNARFTDALRHGRVTSDHVRMMEARQARYEAKKSGLPYEIDPSSGEERYAITSVDFAHLPAAERYHAYRGFASGGDVLSQGSTHINQWWFSNAYEDMVHSPHAKKIAAHLPEGSEFLAHGTDAAVFRTSPHHVVRVGGVGARIKDISSRYRPTHPMVLQAEERHEYGPYVVEKLPYVPALTDKYSEDSPRGQWITKAFANRLRKQGKTPIDVLLRNLGRKGKKILSIDPEVFKTTVDEATLPATEDYIRRHAFGGLIGNRRDMLRRSLASQFGEDIDFTRFAALINRNVPGPIHGQFLPHGKTGPEVQIPRREMADWLVGHEYAHAADYAASGQQRQQKLPYASAMPGHPFHEVAKAAIKPIYSQVANVDFYRQQARAEGLDEDKLHQVEAFASAMQAYGQRRQHLEAGLPEHDLPMHLKSEASKHVFSMIDSIVLPHLATLGGTRPQPKKPSLLGRVFAGIRRSTQRGASTQVQSEQAGFDVNQLIEPGVEAFVPREDRAQSRPERLERVQNKLIQRINALKVRQERHVVDIKSRTTRPRSGQEQAAIQQRILANQSRLARVGMPTTGREENIKESDLDNLLNVTHLTNPDDIKLYKFYYGQARRAGISDFSFHNTLASMKEFKHLAPPKSIPFVNPAFTQKQWDKITGANIGITGRETERGLAQDTETGQTLPLSESEAVGAMSGAGRTDELTQKRLDLIRQLKARGIVRADHVAKRMHEAGLISEDELTGVRTVGDVEKERSQGARLIRTPKDIATTHPEIDAYLRRTSPQQIASRRRASDEIYSVAEQARRTGQYSFAKSGFGEEQHRAHANIISGLLGQHGYELTDPRFLENEGRYIAHVRPKGTVSPDYPMQSQGQLPYYPIQRRQSAQARIGGTVLPSTGVPIALSGPGGVVMPSLPIVAPPRPARSTPAEIFARRNRGIGVAGVRAAIGKNHQNINKKATEHFHRMNDANIRYQEQMAKEGQEAIHNEFMQYLLNLVPSHQVSEEYRDVQAKDMEHIQQMVNAAPPVNPQVTPTPNQNKGTPFNPKLTVEEKLREAARTGAAIHIPKKGDYRKGLKKIKDLATSLGLEHEVTPVKDADYFQMRVRPHRTEEELLSAYQAAGGTQYKSIQEVEERMKAGAKQGTRGLFFGMNVRRKPGEITGVTPEKEELFKRIGQRLGITAKITGGDKGRRKTANPAFDPEDVQGFAAKFNSPKKRGRKPRNPVTPTTVGGGGGGTPPFAAPASAGGPDDDELLKRILEEIRRGNKESSNIAKDKTKTDDKVVDTQKKTNQVIEKGFYDLATGPGLSPALQPTYNDITAGREVVPETIPVVGDIQDPRKPFKYPQSPIPLDEDTRRGTESVLPPVSGASYRVVGAPVGGRPTEDLDLIKLRGAGYDVIHNQATGNIEFPKAGYQRAYRNTPFRRERARQLQEMRKRENIDRIVSSTDFLAPIPTQSQLTSDDLEQELIANMQRYRRPLSSGPNYIPYRPRQPKWASTKVTGFADLIGDTTDRVTFEGRESRGQKARVIRQIRSLAGGDRQLARRAISGQADLVVDKENNRIKRIVDVASERQRRSENFLNFGASPVLSWFRGGGGGGGGGNPPVPPSGGFPASMYTAAGVNPPIQPGRFAGLRAGLGGALGVAGIASQFAPQAIETYTGSVEHPTSDVNTVRRGRQAGGLLSGAAGGAFAGFAVGGPVGAAIGGVIGAFHGLASATKAVDEEIRSVKLGKTLAQLDSTIANVLEGRSSAASGVSAVRAAGTVINKTESEQNYTNTNFQDNMFGRFLHSISLTGGTVGTAQREEARKQLLQEHVEPRLGQLRALNENIAGNLRIDPNLLRTTDTQGNRLSEPQLEQNRQGRIGAFMAAGGDAATQQIVEATPGLTWEKYQKEIDQVIVESSKQRSAQLALTKVINQTELEFQKFGRLDSAIQSTVASMANLQNELDATEAAFGNTLQPIRAFSHVAGAENVSGLDNTAHAKAVGFVTQSLRGNLQGPAGELVSNFGEAATHVNTLRNSLPNIINAANSQGNFEGEGLGNRIKEGVRGLGNIPDSITGRLSDTISSMKPEDLSKQAGENVQKLVDDLLKNGFANVNEVLTNAAKSLEENANNFNAGLIKNQEMINRIGESQDRYAALQVTAAQSATRVRAEMAGRPGQANLSLDTLMAPIQQRQERLTGLAGAEANNPQFIGQRLRSVQQEIGFHKLLYKQAPNDQAAKTTAAWLANLQGHANRLAQALEDLRDPTEKNAIIQEKLNRLEEQRNAKLSLTERLVTASPQERLQLTRNARFSDIAVQQGHLGGLHPQVAAGALEHLSSLGEMELPAYGGRKASDVRQQLLLNTTMQGGVITPGNERQRVGLMRQQAGNDQTAVEAQAEIVSNQENLQGRFFTQLGEMQQEFFNKLGAHFAEAAKKDITAQIGENQGKLNKALGAQQAQQFFAAKGSSVEQARAASGLGLGNLTELRSTKGKLDDQVKSLQEEAKNPQSKLRGLIKTGFQTPNINDVDQDAAIQALSEHIGPKLNLKQSEVRAQIVPKLREQFAGGEAAPEDALTNVFQGFRHTRHAELSDQILRETNRIGAGLFGGQQTNKAQQDVVSRLADISPKEFETQLGHAQDFKNQGEIDVAVQSGRTNQAELEQSRERVNADVELFGKQGPQVVPPPFIAAPQPITQEPPPLIGAPQPTTQEPSPPLPLGGKRVGPALPTPGTFVNQAGALINRKTKRRLVKPPVADLDYNKLRGRPAIGPTGLAQLPQAVQNKISQADADTKARQVQAQLDIQGYQEDQTTRQRDFTAKTFKPAVAQQTKDANLRQSAMYQKIGDAYKKSGNMQQAKAAYAKADAMQQPDYVAPARTNMARRPKQQQKPGEQAQQRTEKKDPMATFGQNVQNLGGVVNGFDKSINNMGTTLSNLANVFKDLKIPEKIEVGIAGRTEVILNGAQLLASIKGDMAKYIGEQIVTQMKEQLPKIIKDIPAT